MDNYFIDTSALFKRYIIEPGTDKLDEIFYKGGVFYISDVTIIEFISNLKRKIEVTKELDNSVYKKIKKEFFNDIALGNLKTVSISSEIIIGAISLLDRSYITPLDSIQLSTALFKMSQNAKTIFICSDKKLSIIAQQNGLKCLFI